MGWGPRGPSSLGQLQLAYLERGSGGKGGGKGTHITGAFAGPDLLGALPVLTVRGVSLVCPSLPFGRVRAVPAAPSAGGVWRDKNRTSWATFSRARISTSDQDR